MPRADVIQGFFPHGLPRFDRHAPPAASSWVQEAIGRPAQIVQRRAAAQQAPQPPMQRIAANAVLVPQTLANRASGPGQPLQPDVRQKMEALFRTSFADVRVHVGPHVAAIGALAFTQSTNIHFAPGQYDPFTARGHHLLGHELTHVVQQRTGRVRNPFQSGVAIVHDRSLEAEAERMGIRAATAPRLPIQAKRPGFIIQRAREAVIEEDFYEEEEVEIALPDGLESTALYRVMPFYEWGQMQLPASKNQPCSGAHFWSSTESYVRKYVGKVDTDSSIFIKIPLDCTVLEFLQEAAAKGTLHAHNFGKAWTQLFGKKKGKKAKAEISLKNDGGTATMIFNSAPGTLPVYLTKHMGAPEQLPP